MDNSDIKKPLGLRLEQQSFSEFLNCLSPGLREDAFLNAKLNLEKKINISQQKDQQNNFLFNKVKDNFELIEIENESEPKELTLC